MKIRVCHNIGIYGIKNSKLGNTGAHAQDRMLCFFGLREQTDVGNFCDRAGTLSGKADCSVITSMGNFKGLYNIYRMSRMGNANCHAVGI